MALQADAIRAMITEGRKPAHIARDLNVARSSVDRMMEPGSHPANCRARAAVG